MMIQLHVDINNATAASTTAINTNNHKTSKDQIQKINSIKDENTCKKHSVVLYLVEFCTSSVFLLFVCLVIATKISYFHFFFSFSSLIFLGSEFLSIVYLFYSPFFVLFSIKMIWFFNALVIVAVSIHVLLLLLFTCTFHQFLQRFISCISFDSVCNISKTCNMGTRHMGETGQISVTCELQKKRVMLLAKLKITVNLLFKVKKSKLLTK